MRPATLTALGLLLVAIFAATAFQLFVLADRDEDPPATTTSTTTVKTTTALG